MMSNKNVYSSYMPPYKKGKAATTSKNRLDFNRKMKINLDSKEYKAVSAVMGSTFIVGIIIGVVLTLIIT